MIDGFGVTGVRGVFMRCCAEVLRVLRCHSLQLLTILEVVIHDPLYKWSLSPNQVKLKQTKQINKHSKAVDDDEEEQDLFQEQANGLKEESSFDKDAAERTINRIKNKLQGIEDPASDPFSVDGQLEFIVNEAQDISNLSKIYFGWAPWL